MKIRVVQKLAVLVACVGMALPQSALAAAPQAIKVADVALQEGGVFVGKVVNAHGKPIAKTKVSIQQQDKIVANAVTDKQGSFAVEGLRGGHYLVVADGGMVAYRMWAPETAPPAANTSALVVTGQEIVNGNHRGGFANFVKQRPMLVAAGIATAIAVPLAVADDDDDNS